MTCALRRDTLPVEIVMANLPATKLDALEMRFSAIEAQLEPLSAQSAAEFVRLSREYAELEPVVRPILAYQKLLADLGAAEDLVGSGDREMAEMAEIEIAELKPRLEEMSQQISACCCCRATSRRQERHPRNPRRHRRRRGGAVRRHPTCTRYADLLEALHHGGEPGEMGGYKEVIASAAVVQVFMRG